MKPTKAVWIGILSLGQLRAPCRLFAATGDDPSAPSLRLLSPSGRPPTQHWLDEKGEEVWWGALRRGVEVATDEFVMLEPEEVEALAAIPTSALILHSVVPSIPIMFFSRPYFLAPDGPAEPVALALLRELLGTQAAIGTITVRRIKRHCAVVVHGRGLLCTTLRSVDEVREVGSLFDRIPASSPPDTIARLQDGLKRFQQPFSAAALVDESAEKLRELIARKTAQPPDVIERIVANDKARRGRDSIARRTRKREKRA